MATSTQQRERPPRRATSLLSSRDRGRARAVVEESRWTIPVVVLVGVALAFSRAWLRIAHPSLLSEDGVVFLKGAREDGFAAFFDTYAGYFHAMPRLASWLMSPLPVTWVPGWYAVVGTVVYLGVVALALSPRLSWLLPYRWQRITLFLALVLAPARDEVTGNLNNFVAVSSLGLLLLALSGDPDRVAGRAGELVALVLMALSGPLCLVVLPVFGARALRLRSRHSITLLVTCAACAALQWASMLTSERTGTGSLGVAPRYVGRRVLPAWLVGDNAVIRNWDIHPEFLLFLCLFLGLLLLNILGMRVPGILALALLSSFVLSVVISSVADGVIPSPPQAQRYLLLPLALITVVVVVGLGEQRALLRIAPGIALALSLVGALGEFQAFYRPPLPLGPTAACLEIGDRPCLLPQYPLHWPEVVLLP